MEGVLVLVRMKKTTAKLESRGLNMAAGHIVGDPFALATISIAWVRAEFLRLEAAND